MYILNTIDSTSQFVVLQNSLRSGIVDSKLFACLLDTDALNLSHTQQLLASFVIYSIVSIFSQGEVLLLVARITIHQRVR